MIAEAPDLTASLENYLEAIFRLSQVRRVVRVRDIAKAVGVTPPSATGAIQQLKQRGLVSHERYEDVLLTDEGEAVAAEVHQRHEELRAFFEDVLLLDAETAEAEACALEHSISQHTLERLRRFLASIGQCGRRQHGCIRVFRQMVADGEGAG
ncbi:MAG: metal-dependent transcriptional regulator [Armatimonadetes bacterium]|nr:metal-dependent transcriptional regulator [Armatimonadota bacterium]